MQKLRSVRSVNDKAVLKMTRVSKSLDKDEIKRMLDARDMIEKNEKESMIQLETGKLVCDARNLTDY